ncbi:MAG: hypothetical protein ACKVT1_00765 [Dehalococcoidia bacterium]
MTDPPKKATEMTTEELARRVFPAEVLAEIQRVAQQPTRLPKSSQEKE